jgi:hypothetical protein
MLAIAHTYECCKNVTPTQYIKTTQQNNVIITLSTYKGKKNIAKHKTKYVMQSNVVNGTNNLKKT